MYYNVQKRKKLRKTLTNTAKKRQKVTNFNMIKIIS